MQPNAIKHLERFLMPSITAGEAFIALIFGTLTFLSWFFTNFIITLTLKNILGILPLIIVLAIPLWMIYFLGGVFFGKRELTPFISKDVYIISIPFIFFIWASYLILIIPKFSDPSFSFTGLSILEQIAFFYAIIALFRLLFLFLFTNFFKLKPPILSFKAIRPVIMFLAISVGLFIFFIEKNGLILSFIKSFTVSSLFLYIFTEIPTLIIKHN